MGAHARDPHLHGGQAPLDVRAAPAGRAQRPAGGQHPRPGFGLRLVDGGVLARVVQGRPGVAAEVGDDGEGESHRGPRLQAGVLQDRRARAAHEVLVQGEPDLGDGGAAGLGPGQDGNRQRLPEDSDGQDQGEDGRGQAGGPAAQGGPGGPQPGARALRAARRGDDDEQQRAQAYRQDQVRARRPAQDEGRGQERDPRHEGGRADDVGPAVGHEDAGQGEQGRRDEDAPAQDRVDVHGRDAADQDLADDVQPGRGVLQPVAQGAQVVEEEGEGRASR